METWFGQEREIKENDGRKLTSLYGEQQITRLNLCIYVIVSRCTFAYDKSNDFMSTRFLIYERKILESKQFQMKDLN
jgi:hypothetical protein